MTRIFLIVLFALMSFSCTRDPLEGARSAQSVTNVALELEIPVSELVATYSAADDAARENSVVRLDVFAFDQTGAIIADAEGHVVFTRINMVNGKGKLTVPVTIPAGETDVKRQFGIVANAVDISAMDAVATLDDFRAMEFGLGSTMQTTNFVMSDMSALNTIDSTNPIINMSLRRAVARVDVVLQDEVTNFEITSVRLINVRDKGFLFGKNSDENDLSSPIAIPATSSVINYDPVDASTDELKRDFTSQLYCLENYNADKGDGAKTTAVIVGGIFNGKSCYYRVNLHDNNSDAQVRRNYIYRVNIRRVNGAGNPDPDAAINDSPQNIDYTISEWDYSLHSDVIFDGKNYLGVSESKFSLPKDVGSGSIDVVSNYTDAEWSFTPCDETGNTVALPSWITYTKEGTKVNFAVKENTAADAAPRVTYLKVAATSNAKLSLIVSVQQYHTDQSLINFEPQIITASWNATIGVFKSKVTILAKGTKWSVEKLTLMDDKAKNWCRLKGGALVGSSGTTTAANYAFDLVFDVDQMSASLLSRTAQVTVKVSDPSGFEETRTMTLTQAAISSSLTVSRFYIAKTAESDVEKIAINSGSAWSAEFWTGDGVNVTKGCTWLSFTDQNYVPLSPSSAASGTGSGAIYVKFDACPANTIRSGYVVVRSGGQQHWIRIHQGDYRTVVIDGYEMLDRNLGATSAPTDPNSLNSAASSTHGFFYQWGRRPDGYEAYAGEAAITYPSTSAATLVTRQPIYGDPAWGRYITRGVAPTINTTTGVQNIPATAHHWLSPDVSITPADQRDLRKLWDARGEAANDIASTNLTSMRTEFDPCPDGWRVPTAREFENILKYGSKQLRPINGSETAANHGRFIANDNGGYVYFPTSNVRRVANATNLATLDASYPTTSAGWYWTSSYSIEAGPYALRLHRSDVPDVIYTHRTGRKTPVVYPAVTTAIDNMAGGNTMSVRCIRDRKITEELTVSVRRKTISNAAQALAVNLTANNLLGTWSASSNASWLSVSPAGGSGDGTLDLHATANNSREVRQGAIRIISSSGTVATIVVVQVDDSGVLVEAAGGIKRWWQSRNVGATRSDFVALNDDNVGYFYGWGANVPTRYEGVTAPVVSSKSSQAWNLATTQITTYGNFPYPIKHPNNDPCPDGWRVPSYDELDNTYLKGPTASKITLVTANGWPANGKTGSGIWFPATCARHASGQELDGNRTIYYFSSLLESTTPWYMSNPPLAMYKESHSRGMAIRCVQETSDSFD